MAIEPITALTESQIDDLLDLFRQEWWTKGRDADGVRRALAGSDVIVGFCDVETKRLVAFARVLTDHVYKALVLDVIVASTHRRTGLGRALLDAVVGHPALRGVRHFELYCRPEMVPFYAQWNFTEDVGGLRFMRRAT